MRGLLTFLAFALLPGAAAAQTPAPTAQPESFWTDKAHRKQGEAPIPVSSFSQVVARVAPAVVAISVRREVPDTAAHDLLRRFFGGQLPDDFDARQDVGSGFIIHPDGYVVTNHHVIEDAAAIRVQLRGRDAPLPAQVVGSDERTDIALIKLESSEPLPFAPLGDSDALEIAEWVVAIGNPFGLNHTVTAGIVSAKGRRDVRPGGKRGYYDFIQTDASINPGNSGGPLIDLSGSVVGINTAINTAGQGIGFAIPINMARRLLPSLRAGKVQHSWLGVSIQTVTPELAASFGFERPHGGLVSLVVEDSPAHRAGLREGDVIVEFDGKRIEDADQLPWLAASAGVGRPVAVKVVRGGVEAMLEVVLGKLREADAASAPPESPTPAASARTPITQLLDIEVEPVPALVAEELGLIAGRGVLVRRVRKGGGGDQAGLRAGDVVLEVGKVEVSTPEAFASAFEIQAPGSVVRLYLRRHDGPLFVAFRYEP